MSVLHDITGRRFSRFLVLYHEGGRKWMCRCDCGTVKSVDASSMKSGKSTSCGCFKVERTIATLTKHGKAGSNRTSEYGIWKSMRQRVSNPNMKYYSYYGGRGIKVCERWKNSFENFLSDMGEKPSPQHSIERRDNDGDYCPENCYWATRKEQCRNRRGNTHITHKGETKLLIEWAEMTGASYKLLHARMKKGMTLEQALQTPVRHKKK